MILGASLIDISIVLATLIIASIVYLYFRDRQMISGLKEFLKKGGYKLRVQPPIKTPFTYEQLARITSYDGRLKPDLPYTLILGTRITGEGKESVSYYYVGFYFAPQTKLSDEWLQGWERKVAERGDRWAVKSNAEKVEANWGSKGAPDHLPIRAARVDGGGIILAWNGLHTGAHIEERINDILASL